MQKTHLILSQSREYKALCTGNWVAEKESCVVFLRIHSENFHFFPGSFKVNCSLIILESNLSPKNWSK